MGPRYLQPFGVEVINAEIASASATDVATILDLAVRHRVVVIRGQLTASDGDFVRFLARFGKLTFTDGEAPVPAANDLNIVSNVGRTTPPRSVFHTDTSYIPCPPSFGALRAVTVPGAGGSTLFSDQVRAAADLPTRVREWLRGRTVRHGVRQAEGLDRHVRHPLLARHPVTGEIALFLSTPERCSALSGVDDATSARIIRLLYERSIRGAGLLTHIWRPGDIVLWDNRATMHRADHRHVIGDRILHRGLIQGDVPIAA